MITWGFKLLLAAYLMYTLPFWTFNLLQPVPADILDRREGFEVGLVLGASVRENSYPSDVLQRRLDKSIEAYRRGLINKILVSGDNRAEDYDEPKVMKAYLVDQGVPAQDIIQDFAGRRTLDSCWRAKHVFRLDKVVLITQPFHMPRSVYLCRQMGLETSYLMAQDSRKRVTASGILREFPAGWLALYDVLSGQKAEVQGDGTEMVEN